MTSDYAPRASLRAWLLAGTALLIPAGAKANDFLVTDPADTGAAGQYRTQVNAANAAPGPDRILFNVSPAITSSLTISDSLTIGAAAPPATISGTGIQLFNGAGALTGNIAQSVTLTNSGDLTGRNFVSIGVTGGAWTLTIDGTVAPPAVACGQCSRFAIAVTAADTVINVNSTAIVNGGTGAGTTFTGGIIAYNPNGFLGIAGAPAVIVNVLGGTVTATATATNGIGATGIVLLGVGSTVNMTGGLISSFVEPAIAIRQGTVNITGGSVTTTGLPGVAVQGRGGVAIEGQGNFLIGAGATVTGNFGISIGAYLYHYSGSVLEDISGPAIPNQVTIAGTVTGSGGTSIFFGTALANTLTLHPTAVINGTVDANFGGSDRLQLGGPGAGTFDVSQIGPFLKYQGFETFAKVDASTWTLTGTNTAALPWSVNSGTLIVAGSMPNSTFSVQTSTLSVTGTTGAITVNSGGVLNGTGTIGSLTVNNGGTLSPGNSIGTITVNGNLTFNAGSTYQVEVSPTIADKTIVTGTATLNGTVNAIFGPGSYNATSYTILTAGARLGQFSLLTTSGLPSFLTASLNYTSTDVLLVTLSSQIAATTCNTRNQCAVAFALDAAFNAGKGVFPGFGALTAGQIPAALDALSGEIHASVLTTLADDSLFVRSAVLGRLRQAAYLNDGTAMASLALGGPVLANADQAEVTAYASQALNAYAADLPFKAPPARVNTPDLTFWAQAFGAWGTFDSDGNAVTAKRTLGGFISGFDRRFGDWRTGLAAGYTASRLNVDARLSSATIDSAHLAGYLGRTFGAFNLRSGAAASWHDISVSRTAAFPGFLDALRTSYYGNTVQVFGEVGYGMMLQRLAVEPYAGLAWVRVETNGFSELGGAAALMAGSAHYQVGYTSLGVRVATNVMIGSSTVVPHLTVAWQHALNSVTPTTALAFLGTGAGFTISGVPLARDSALVDTGFDVAIARNTTVGVSYVGQLADTVQDHAVKGRATVRF